MAVKSFIVQAPGGGLAQQIKTSKIVDILSTIIHSILFTTNESYYGLKTQE
jgi:hypothetical protein